MTFPASSDPDNPSELDRLQVAFAVNVAKAIVDADGILHLDEISLLQMTFPNPWMRACGFINEDTQLTPEVGRWYQRARKELPRRLDLSERLNLVTLFHRTCLADGELHDAELQVLMDAARKLQIPRGEVRRHLGHLRCGGTLVPPVQVDQGEH